MVDMVRGLEYQRIMEDPGGASGGAGGGSRKGKGSERILPPEEEQRELVPELERLDLLLEVERRPGECAGLKWKQAARPWATQTKEVSRSCQICLAIATKIESTQTLALALEKSRPRCWGR